MLRYPNVWIRDSIWFAPITISAAVERLELLHKLLLDIEEQRNHEVLLRGWVNYKELIRLQTLAGLKYQEVLRYDLPLLVCISSLEEVHEWRVIMPEVLKDTRPVLDEDRFHFDTNPVDRDLVKAYTCVHTWLEQLLPGSTNRKVFIVHGHDEAKKWELKNLLVKLSLDPIVLHEQDDLGMTIIEKFEHYASQCTFSFVLLTPDDAAIIETETEESQWRARQNVIMELGWFMAKLGRRRVTILHKGQIELPSDIHGMLYLRIERSVDEVSAKIIQRLRAENIIR